MLHYDHVNILANKRRREKNRNFYRCFKFKSVILENKLHFESTSSFCV